MIIFLLSGADTNWIHILEDSHGFLFHHLITHWLRFLVLCWTEVVDVAIFAFFLFLEYSPLGIHHWVWYFLWVFQKYFLLYWSCFLAVLFSIFFFYHEKSLHYFTCFSLKIWEKRRSAFPTLYYKCSIVNWFIFQCWNKSHLAVKSFLKLCCQVQFTTDSLKILYEFNQGPWSLTLYMYLFASQYFYLTFL